MSQSTVTDAVAPGNIQAVVLMLQMTACTLVALLMTIFPAEEARKRILPAETEDKWEVL